MAKYYEMEEFPELNKDQVALLRADINTGIILDLAYKYATKDDQKVFTVFENLDDAIEFAKKIILEKKDIECCIYRKENELLYFLDLESLNKQ
jgi:hypothetical protein